MLSIALMLEMGRRVQGDGQFWRPDTAALALEAAQQAAYCLDAPDDMPAGGMYSDAVDGMAVPTPMVADREPPNARLSGCPRRRNIARSAKRPAAVGAPLEPTVRHYR